MPRITTFASEVAKWRMDNAEDWLAEAERILRETIEGLERQADSCRLARETMAELRAQAADVEAVEALAGGPVTMATDAAA